MENADALSFLSNRLTAPPLKRHEQAPMLAFIVSSPRLRKGDAAGCYKKNTRLKAGSPRPIPTKRCWRLVEYVRTKKKRNNKQNTHHRKKNGHRLAMSGSPRTKKKNMP